MDSENREQEFSYVFNVITDITSGLRANPTVPVLFTGTAVLLVWLSELIEQYSWEFKALASHLVPELFDGSFVFPPRAPFVAAFVGVAVVVTGWVIAVTCGTSVYRLAPFDRDGSTSVSIDVRRSIALSGQILAYLVVVAVLTVAGLLAFVLPGVLALIRLFVGLPILLLEDRSVRGAVRESWRRTAGHEVGIGLVVAMLAAALIVLAAVPVVGHVVAFVVAGSSAVVASVTVNHELVK